MSSQIQTLDKITWGIKWGQDDESNTSDIESTVLWPSVSKPLLNSFITFYITFTSFIYIPAAVMLANLHNMEQSLRLTVNVGIKLNVRLSSKNIIIS